MSTAPLIVFADDWGRHPSSCQHLISQLLPHRRVVWVNTIGMKPPKLNMATVTRGFEKVKQWLGASGGRKPLDSATPPVRPEVLNPKMWPSFHSRLGRGLNRRLLARALRPIAEAMPEPPIVITTLPLVADLVGTFPAARWVYYCVDDFGVWPGLDGRTLRDMEAELVAKVDSVVAVSETLQGHIAKLGKPSHLLTHGVDLEHFRRRPEPAAQARVESTLACASGSGPIMEPAAQASVIVFWGVIDRRMDVDFVRKIHEVNRSAWLLFFGPQDDPDSDLFRMARVRVGAAVAYDDLSSIATAASVLIMPYADLPVTRAMQPLKLKEYLATGKPVVVRKLPSTESWSDCCDVCETPEAFANAVLDRLKNGVPESQRAARARLDRESWSAKAEQFEKWITGY